MLYDARKINGSDISFRVPYRRKQSSGKYLIEKYVDPKFSEQLPTKAAAIYFVEITEWLFSHVMTTELAFSVPTLDTKISV